MSISVLGFRGRIPRLTPALLPNSCAQIAVNVRLLNGDLVPLNDVLHTLTFSGGPFKSIFWLNYQYMLRWAGIVDVAKSPVLEDSTGRIMFTAYGGGDVPRITNIALATGTTVTTTKGTFVVADVGLIQIVPVVDSALFQVGATVFISTVGTPDFFGTVTATALEQITVQTISIFSGSAGDTMPSGATVTQQEPSPTQVSYPWQSFKLGSPAPLTAAGVVYADGQFVVPADDIDRCTDIGTWTLGTDGTAEVDAVLGNPLPSFRAKSNFVNPPNMYFYKALGMDTPASVMTVDFNNASATTGGLFVFVGADDAGAGPMFVLQPGAGTFEISSGTATSWAAGFVRASFELGPPFVAGAWYTVRISYMGFNAAGFQYVLNIYDDVMAQIFSKTYILPTGPGGPNVGFRLVDTTFMNVDNIGTVALIAASDVESANYAYTYVTGLGEESAPSPVSVDIIQDSGGAVTKVITFPLPPTTDEQTAYGTNYIPDYDIIGRRLYRSLTGTSSTYNLVVDETVLPLSVVTYTDNIPDDELGVELPSDGWTLPPADGHSIIALSNGITAMASKNTLFLSPVGQPHTFPYKLPTDTKVIGLGSIDTTLVVLTQGFPYLASGLDPATYGMSKQERSEGCVSHRSIAYLRQFGVLYASSDGLMAIAGAGIRNLTQAYFTQKDWLEQIRPETIIASVKDDRYVAFYQPVALGPYKGFIFDPREEGQAFTTFELSTSEGPYPQTYADGFFTDDLTGDLYMVRGSALDRFDKGNPLTYTWRGKIFRQSMPTSMVLARAKPLKGYDYMTTPITFRYVVDGTTVFTKVITNRMPFTLPAMDESSGLNYEDLSFELSGNWTMQQMDIAQHPEELA